MIIVSKNQFYKKFENRKKINQSSSVEKVVNLIIEDIRLNRDKALFKYIKKFENKKFIIDHLVISKQKLKKAYDSLSSVHKKSLKIAYSRIKYYHQKTKRNNIAFNDNFDTKFDIKYNPIENVGLYIPGGMASYPSTVLMTSIPAKIAGCPNIYMTVPSKDGITSDLTLAAAYLAGVTKVYNMGGAHAIAALALGTKSVAKVDKIFGPGNSYVAEAKRKLFGEVGIDLPAGPSEVCVIIDEQSNVNFAATDILAQAEHDPNAKTYLLSASKIALEKTVKSIKTLQKKYNFNNVSRSLKNFFPIHLKNIAEIIEITNFIAPEHLQIATNVPKNISSKVRNSGSVFIGQSGTIALGDYAIGTNHVLPTDQTARFASGLGVDDFMKKTVIINSGPKTFNAISDSVINLATAEGLPAHALSVEIRKKRK